MPKPTEPQPLSLVYRTAWEAVLALWPLLLLRFLFLVLNFGAFFLCLFLAAWPLVRALWAGLQESRGEGIAGLIQRLNLSSYASDLHWLFLVLGLGLLYITWWSLLDALFDGAVYGRFRAWQEKGEAFSMGDFLRDGLRYLGPMIGLQMCWFLVLAAVLVVLMFLGLGGVLLFQFLSIPWWIGVFLALPLCLGVLVLLAGLMAWAVLGGAYLMEEEGVLTALRRSLGKCLEEKGRAVWALLLVWGLYLVFSISFQKVMEVLGFLPWIGVLFVLAQFAVSLLLSILLWVLMPALAVVLSLEKEGRA